MSLNRIHHSRRDSISRRRMNIARTVFACASLVALREGRAQRVPQPVTAPASAQTGAELPTRSINELIQALPGRFIPLAQLVRAALDHGLDAQLASAERRVIEADAMIAGRVIDPTLQLASGLTSNGTVDATAFRTAQAQVAGTLPYGTQLSAALTRGPGRDIAGTSLFSQQNVYGLAISQPLLDGFNQRTTDWRATRIERTAAVQTFARARESVAADIELLYWNLAEAQASEAVYQRSLELAQTLLSRNTELAKRDMVAEVDVLTSRGAVALRTSTLIQARQARRDASDRLLFAAYGDRASEEVLRDSLPVKSVDTPSGAVSASDLSNALSTATRQRKDLIAAQGRREAAQLRVSQTRNALLPGLSFEGGYSSTPRSGVATDGSSLGRNNAWRVGLSVSAPFWNYADRGGALRASAVFDVQDVTVRSTLNTVQLETRAAVRAVQSVRERLAAAEQAASLAWDQLLAERKRLDLGLGDSFRLLQTEENAVRAQLEAVRAQYELARAQVRFRYATGVSAIP